MERFSKKIILVGFVFPEIMDAKDSVNCRHQQFFKTWDLIPQEQLVRSQWYKIKFWSILHALFGGSTCFFDLAKIHLAFIFLIHSFHLCLPLWCADLLSVPIFLVWILESVIIFFVSVILIRIILLHQLN